MSEMVERIILKWRETAPSVSAFSDNLLVLLAIRQMQAMRESTEPMMEAATKEFLTHDRRWDLMTETLMAMWRAMLDAAMAEETQP